MLPSLRTGVTQSSNFNFPACFAFVTKSAQPRKYQNSMHPRKTEEASAEKKTCDKSSKNEKDDSK